MSSFEFTKVQGLGNDFIIIEDLEEKFDFKADLIARLCNRRFGIGADGVMIVRLSQKGNFVMLFYNPDGSQAEMCGNGIRCFAKYLYDRKLTDKENITVETLAGLKEVALIFENQEVVGAKVSMGKPSFGPKEIPVLLDSQEVVNKEVDTGKGKVKLTCLSMGNPHAVLFVDDVFDAPVESLGPAIENLPIFPNRTNVEFAQVLSQGNIKLRVWERGAGETLACGTGACAAAVAACRNGLVERKVKVDLLGGEAEVEWSNEDEVYLIGPAKEVFTGKIDINKL